MMDAVAPVGGFHFVDAVPVPGRQWLRYVGDAFWFDLFFDSGLLAVSMSRGIRLSAEVWVPSPTRVAVSVEHLSSKAHLLKNSILVPSDSIRMS